MILRCDVVKCIYNVKCKCGAAAVDITLTHDGVSGEEYIVCTTCIEKSETVIKPAVKKLHDVSMIDFSR